MPTILIIGAGPTGLTAAVELARQGIVPVVIDKRDSASGFSRAVGIQPASMEILGRSGAAQAIREEAVMLTGALIHKGIKPVARLRLDVFSDPDDHLYGLAQDRTEHHLAEAFARYGGKVQFGRECLGLSQDADSVIVQINDTAQTFDYVIGADGIGSTVRKSLGLAFEGYDLPEKWSIADVDVKDLPEPALARIFVLPHGKAALVVPLEAHRFRVISNTEDALATLPIALPVTNIRRAGSFRISIRQVNRYAEGRVFLAGDAAHCHSPVGGRGMNLGIADAADLARRFVNGGLDGYHAARHAEGQKVLKFSETGRKMMMASNPVQKFALFTLLWLLDRFPALNRRAAMGMLR